MTNQLVERPWKIELHDEGEKKGQPKIHQILWDTEVKGFGLRYFFNKDGEVTTRTYFLQCRVGKKGKMRVIKIGIHNDTHRVDQARAEAFDLKARLMKGYDPVEEKAKQEEAERQQKVLDAGKNATLRQVMEHYLIHRRTKYGPLREGTKQSIRSKIESYLTAWLDEPMAATITRDACLVRFTELSDTEVQKNGTVGKKDCEHGFRLPPSALQSRERDVRQGGRRANHLHHEPGHANGESSQAEPGQGAQGANPTGAHWRCVE
jgi:hypothetical protein